MPVKLLSVASVAIALSAASLPGQALAQAIVAERMGVYLAVDNLARAQAFYEALFGAPQVRNAGLVGFDVAGGLFAVVDRRTYAPTSKIGGNVVPYIKVADIDAVFAQVRATAPGSLASDKVTTEGPFRFFRLVDPDGNMVELFAITPPR